MNIFLSYASDYRRIADDMCCRLQAVGHDVFFDREDLPAGASFDDRIRQAIDDCELFIFLVSPAAVADGHYTRTELKLASRKWPTPGWHVLPVMVAPTPLDTIPPYLRALTLMQAEGNLTAEVVFEVEERVRRHSATPAPSAPPPAAADPDSVRYRSVQLRFGRDAAGAFMGWAGGRALGFVLFRVPKGAILAETGSGVIAFAGVLLCYGSTELVEGYGFIAVAVLGLTLRRIEEEHHFHRRLHDSSEAVEHALTAILLVALGTALPSLLADMGWDHVLIALALIAVIRPLSGWISLIGTDLGHRSRAVISIYGVRGIGSIYYLGYAGIHMEFANETQLWSLVALAILLSTLLHGFSVAWAMDRLRDDRD